MSATMLITVNLYKDPLGYWWADSDDLFGLHVWKKTKRELVADIPEAIKALLEANGYTLLSVKERPALPKGIRTESNPRQTKTIYILESEPVGSEAMTA